MRAEDIIFWIVEGGEPIAHVRHGSCNMCGECCCKHDISGDFTSALVEDDEAAKEGNGDWSKWEGWSAHSQHGLWWWWKMKETEGEQPCESFIKGRCAWWDQEGLSAICRDWPVHPDNLKGFPDCGFWFERKGEE